MTIVEAIQEVFEGIEPNGTFAFDSEVKGDAGERYRDKAVNSPFCLISPNVNGEATIVNSQFNDRLTLRVFFLTFIDSNWTTYAEIEANIVEPMRQLGINTLTKVLYQYPTVVTVDETTNIPHTDIYKWGSGRHAGAMFTFSVKQKRELNLCTTPITFDINLSSTTGGTAISSLGGEGDSPFTVDKNTNVAFNATPETGYRFRYWLLNNIQSLTNPLALIITKGYNIVAEFIKTWQLTTSVSGNGTISPVSGTYDDGDIVEIVAEPTDPETTELEKIEVNSVEVANTSPYLLTMTDNNKNVIAYFRVLDEIPFLNDAVEVWNGNIIENDGNYYLEGAKGVGDLLITNYDFPTGWSVGIPYKTEATISAPAGNATLIAADVNNYFYDSGGTPNQIPVISLFQDIEYEHKLFCRHTERLILNNIEVKDAYIDKIALYNTIKTGVELTDCNTYFEVPEEDVTTMAWVSSDGNDSTGDGSKSNPFQTLSAIRATTKTNVYVKNGNYDLTAALIFTVGTDLNIIGTGLCEFGLIAYNCSVQRNLLLKNFIINNDGAVNGFLNTKTLSFERCKITKTDTGQVTSPQANSNDLSFINCIINANTSFGAIRPFGSTDSLNFIGCIGSVLTSFGTNQYQHSIVVNYNKLNNTFLSLSHDTSIQVYNNTIDNSAGSKIAISIKGADNTSCNDNKIKYNIITANNNSSYVFYIGAYTEGGVNAYNNVEFIGNKIININNNAGTSHDTFFGAGIDPIIKYNRIESGNGYNIVIKSGGALFATTDMHISYNILKTNNAGFLIHSIYARGANGVIVGNNTLVNFKGSSIFNCDANGGGFDNELLIINNLIDIEGNTLYKDAASTNITTRNNSINKNGFTITLEPNDSETSVVIDNDAIPAERVNSGESVIGDNSTGLASDYKIPNGITTNEQDANWQRGSVVL